MYQNEEKNNESRSDSVREFYTSYNDGERDMTTLEHGRRGIPILLKVLIFLILAACGVAAWIGYRSFNGEQIPFFQFAKKDTYIDVKVSAIEKEIVSNGLFTVRLFLKNTSPAPLDPVSIIIDYPEGFIFHQASPILPKNEQKNYWEIGSLTSGEEITLTVTGRITSGTSQDEKNLHTTVFYKPVSLSSEFKAEVDTLLSVNSPQFRLRIDGPVEIENGREGNFEIVFHKPPLITNPSDVFVQPPLEVLFEHPSSFIAKEIKPVATKERLRWDVASLDPDSFGDDTVSISVRGLFQGENTSAPLVAKIGYYLGEEFIPLDQTQFLPSLAVPFEKNLSLSLTVDQKKSPAFLTPADPELHKGIPLTIAYENTGKITLENVSFNVHIPKNSILISLPNDWNIPSSEPPFSYSFHEQEDNQIRITSAEIPALSQIGPSATGTISLMLRNMDYQSLRTLLSQGNLNEEPLTISLNADIDGPQKRSLSGPQVIVKRNSDTSFRANTSSGTTPSAIEWIIENSLHELENIRVSAILSESITWTQNSSLNAGTIRYNPNTREVLWTINRLPTSVKSISARFELEGISSEGQAGTVTTFTAKDKTTGALISIQKTF